MTTIILILLIISQVLCEEAVTVEDVPKSEKETSESNNEEKKYMEAMKGLRTMIANEVLKIINCLVTRRKRKKTDGCICMFHITSTQIK